MKILKVFNPTLTDYVVSGSATLPRFLGESLRTNYGVQVDYVASEALKGLVSPESKIYTPEVRKRCAVRDTIEFTKQIFKSEKYDLIHVHMAQMSVLNAIHDILKGLPVVYTFHSAAVLGRFSLGYRESGRLISQDPSVRVTCPSKTALKIWEQFIETEEHPSASVVLNGVQLYSDIKGTSLSDSDYYVSVGRVEPDKRMLEIAELCDKYHHKIVFVANCSIGTVQPSPYILEYQDKFDKLCKESPYITRYESMSNYELRELMFNSKGYISFSKSETLCLAILEAITSGLPILYIEEDSTKEVTSSNNSLMIPNSDIYRKSYNNKLQIFEMYFKEFENKINSQEFTRESVIKDSRNYKITADDCAGEYYKLYQIFLESFHKE